MKIEIPVHHDAISKIME